MSVSGSSRHTYMYTRTYAHTPTNTHTLHTHPLHELHTPKKKEKNRQGGGEARARAPQEINAGRVEWGVIRLYLNSAVSETFVPSFIHSALTLGVCLCAWRFLCVNLLLNVLQHQHTDFSLLAHCVLYSTRSLAVSLIAWLPWE